VFLSKALHRRIAFLSRRDTLRLITEPVSGRVRYAEGVPERIAGLTAGQPFYTQVICQTIVDHLNEEQKHDVAAADLEKVVGEVIENPLPQMIFNWNALSHVERLALAIVAEISKGGVRAVAADAIRAYAQRERIGYEIDPVELNKALEGLFHADLLSKASDESGYTFRMDLWRLWVTRMHSVWQVVDEIEKAGGEAPGEGLTKAGQRRRRGLSFAQGAAMVAAGAALLAMGRFVVGQFDDDSDARRRDDRSIFATRAPVDSARLVVTSEPVGAEVYLGGALLGTTPLDRSVPARRGAVTVVRPGYKDRADSIDLAAAESVGLHVSLEERVGAVRVSSTPPGAEILLDGKSAGVATPATLSALSVARLHDVTLRLAGFAPRTFAGVRAVEDSTIALAHTFSRETFALRINSEPAGATVFLDGQNLGQTPQIAPQVTSGSHDLRLVKAGFAEARQTIDVPRPDVTITLERLTPAVIVFSVQPYAEVLIDGEPAGDHTITYLSVSRPPGEYTIELRHPEFARETRVVRVAPGDTVRVSHSFLSGGGAR
jgi:hypothetical protein